ncbi:adenosylcobinamide-GDP ribazoletransferase, partial [Burkholderia gladioli]|uniref:adenosylcobinamide-GDP ribazoletransferase n=1 Tax=Burkholderia gladioli TaxID=28095 RepID=UPI001641CAEB
CVGALAAGVYLLAARIWPPGVAVLLSMAASLAATGAFHEDGLRIMRDSRIGSFGAVALVLALALKWQALAALPPLRAAWTLL